MVLSGFEGDYFQDRNESSQVFTVKDLGSPTYWSEPLVPTGP